MVTLRESASVLLIIGSAVVGPIEGKQFPLTAEDRSLWDRCLEEMKSSEEARRRNRGIVVECNYKLAHLARFEAIAETCARAMKEIGARWEPRAGSEGAWVMQKITGPHTVTDEVIRCIPAPSGLVKR